MQTSRRQKRQSGFTLVELIAVIGVVGVVSATAVPRLTALTGEARYASLKTAQRALLSVASSAHGQFMIDGAATQDFEDVSLPMVHGYPGADPAVLEAAGLARGYTVKAADAGSLTIVPGDLAGTAGAARCYLVYTQSSGPRRPPAVTLAAQATADSCT